MKRFRTFLFWCHLSGGIAAGSVLFVMCATGALLSLKPQILNVVERDVRFVVPRSVPRATPARLLAALRDAEPGVQPMSIAESRDRSASVAVGVAGSDTVYLDPYTGEVLGHGSARSQAFFRSVEDWHRWLAVSMEHRAAARSITDAATLIFCCLAVSGLVLWWPRMRGAQNARPLFWFRRAATPRARDFNWHNTIGFWSSAGILVMTLTGIVMAYPWANDLLYRVAGSAPPAAAQRAQRGAGDRRASAQAPFRIPENIDAVWQRAVETVPTWSTINMRVAARGPVTLTITDGAYWNPFARSQLVVDGATAAISGWGPYAGASAGQKARGWVRFAHTGELGGWPGQLAAGLSCIGGLFLVWTGWSLAIRRLLARRRPRARQDAPARAA